MAGLAWLEGDSSLSPKLIRAVAVESGIASRTTVPMSKSLLPMSVIEERHSRESQAFVLEAAGWAG